MPVDVGVDKVNDEIVVAVDALFTRMMKMELLESVGLVADYQCAAGSIVHHDRVAIIDDAERHNVVIESEYREIGFLGIGNVNR